jgi:hypothetical protein
MLAQAVLCTATATAGATPGTTSTSLPEWMIYFAFWTSAVLFVLKLAEFLYYVGRAPRVDARLTQDVFFRLTTDWGETLFCNAVLLGWNGASLITDCRLTLKRTDTVVKVFPFKVLGFGEKVKGTGPLPDHYFPSASPLRHVPESDPQRILYLCVQQAYQEKSRSVATEFNNKVLEYKQLLLQQAPEAPVSEQDALKKVNEIVDASLSSMIELVQIEPGNYIVSLEVDYVDPKSKFRRKKTSHSAIKFRIGADLKDVFRVNLRQTLLVAATNLIKDQQVPVIYPEYVPHDVAAINLDSEQPENL